MRTWLLVALAGWAIALVTACARSPSVSDTSPTSVPTPGDDRRLAKARVLKVIDGVTVDLEIDGRVHRLRYLGLNAPDEDPVSGSARPLGEEALAFNRFLVEGRGVELERDAVDSDPMGNLLRYVYVDGEMVNLTLLLNGLAAVGEFPAAFRYQTEFLIAEQSARSNQRGVWSRSTAGDTRRPASPGATPTVVPRFSGGTLPQPPSASGATPTVVPRFSGGTLPRPPGAGVAPKCDYSGTTNPVIKGNMDSRTGERIYHVPGGLLYSTTEVDEAQGDRWFCTEAEAIAAGWRRSTH